MRLLLAFCLSVWLILPGRAQDRVRNVRIRVIDSAQLEIRYDLLDARPGDSVYLHIESRLRGDLYLLPEFVRGDIGTRITAGSDRRIVWDALANEYSLNEDIRATVLVKSGPSSTPNQPVPAVAQAPPVSAPIASQPAQVDEPLKQPAETNGPTSRKTRYAGPAWALLSAVAPGMGNMFVQTPKPKVGLRPLLTVGCYGLVAYGLMERQKSLDTYAMYEQQKNITAGEPYYQTANNHHHTYFLATRGAVLVAAADVVLTFVKGLRNSRSAARRFQSVTLWPGVQAGQPTAVVHYSF